MIFPFNMCFSISFVSATIFHVFIKASRQNKFDTLYTCCSIPTLPNKAPNNTSSCCNDNLYFSIFIHLNVMESNLNTINSNKVFS